MNLTVSNLVFVGLVALTFGAVLAVGVAREAVRGALAAALGFVGVGLLFIWMGADFIGFIQLLVYVGAVAVLIVFVILLTRRKDELATGQEGRFTFGWKRLVGHGLPLLIFTALAYALMGSKALERVASEATAIDIAALGGAIVSDGLLPLFLTGILLTVALIGGVGLALANTGKEGDS
ncbi:MAG: NADH-quinone oxidoreductase subunit J [Opitutales bacterium]